MFERSSSCWKTTLRDLDSLRDDDPKHALNQALQTMRQVQGRCRTAAALSFASSCRVLGGYRGASQVLRRILAFEVEDTPIRGEALRRMGLVQTGRGEHDDGMRLAMQALAIAALYGDDRMISETFGTVGLILFRVREFESSIEAFSRSLRAGGLCEDGRFKANLTIFKAWQRLGRFDPSSYRAIEENLHLPKWASLIHYLRGEVLSGHQKHADAAQSFVQAAAHFALRGEIDEVAFSTALAVAQFCKVGMDNKALDAAMELKGLTRKVENPWVETLIAGIMVNARDLLARANKVEQNLRATLGHPQILTS